MWKKIILVIAVIAVILAVQGLTAQQRDADRPRQSELRDPPRPDREPAVMPERGQRAERGDIERGRRESAERGDQLKPEARVPMEGRRRPAQLMAPAKIGPMQEGLGKWLDELTKAYRANDREKMGEIIRQMQQLRQQWQGPAKVPAEPPRDYPQAPKMKKLPAGPEKEKKAPEPAKKTPQVWQQLQGKFPGGPAGWGRCPRCGWCPWWGAGAGRGMALRQRGFGWFRPQGPPPVMDRPTAPMPREDAVKPMLPELPRGPGRRGRAFMPPMNPGPGGPEREPEPAEPRLP